MPGSQGNEEGFNLSHKDGFNILYVLVKAHAMCFYPLLRKNFGSEALGWSGLAAFILMLVVGSFGRIPELMGFIVFWMVVMLYHRVSTMRQPGRGVVRHSRYEGDVDTRIFRNPRTVRRLVEPVFCLIVGVCIEYAGMSHGFAVFVGMGFVSLAMVEGIDRQLDNKRVQAMRDAAIEQEYLAARFRGEIEEP